LKTIIAGSRSIQSFETVKLAIFNASMCGIPEITQVVSGTARGVDLLGEKYARLHNISIKQFPAEWSKYGKSAGYKRNVQMAIYADALISVWDGESRGSQHMINIAKEHGLEVYVFKI